jgi:hypothetical protein
MFALLRRLLFLWLLMFWQGGFFFYSAVVVHIGIALLGDAEQGLITQQVTNWLNLAGAVALAAWAWDIAAEPSPAWMRRLRWLTWLVLAVMLAVLAWLHIVMDGHLDPETQRFTDRDGFRVLHRWYLWISTVQWMGSVLLSWWTLRVWLTVQRIDSACQFENRTLT